ncbi:MAG: sodium:proton antiporter [Candidatus Marinimicrobia bacterium]|nr:sodium:proton antiporter [Candidatus Neomarinimicrobiota bacterium]
MKLIRRIFLSVLFSLLLTSGIILADTVGDVPEGEIVHVVAGHHSAPHVDGAHLSIIWAVPFIGILLSIAVFPLVTPHFWHHHFGKVSTFWAIILIIPFIIFQGLSVTVYELLHVSLLEYIPFIILLLALFTISGGVRVTGSLQGSPIVNTGIILLGTILASWMGTTGAAMMLIRPLIRANKWRKNNVHVIVFFIFLVANIGGSLTPLGDPPLFLGFLKGVDFFWTTTNMLMPMLTAVAILLVIFFGLDSYFYWQEQIPTEISNSVNKVKFGLEGKVNLVLLLGVIGAVLLSGFWHPGISYNVYHVEVELQNLVRDVLLLSLTVASWKITSLDVRKANEYSWFPIMEVAKLFAGIFVTIIPAIAILKAGTDGALSLVIKSVSDSHGNPVNYMYFWATGVLSSFLDNAPTYLVFFNTAGGDPVSLMTTGQQTLLAISAGAVFMGANTYIGNAPNFMVKSISEEAGINMPSFFGFMLKYSIPILIPIFIIISLIYF